MGCPPGGDSVPPGGSPPGIGVGGWSSVGSGAGGWPPVVSPPEGIPPGGNVI